MGPKSISKQTKTIKMFMNGIMCFVGKLVLRHRRRDGGEGCDVV